MRISASKFSEFILVLLKAAVCVWLLFAVGCLFLITPHADESWILLGLRSCLEPYVPDLSQEAIPTSGGLFALANVAIEAVFGSVVWIHRLFSLACLFLLGVLVAKQGDGRRQTSVALLAVAPLLGVPGTAEIGTAALGTAAAVMLLMLAGFVWFQSTAPGFASTILSGLLFGLAASSRFDVILFAPALLMLSALNLDEQARLHVRVPWAAIGVVVVALAVFSANYFLTIAASHHFRFSGVDFKIQHWAGITGVSASSLNYPYILNKLVMALEFSPLALLTLASLVGAWLCFGHPRPVPETQARFVAFLVLFAWIHWIGWIWRASFPNLRYLWPGLACFAIVGGQGLARLYERAQREGWSLVAISCQVLALAFVVGGLGGTFRSLVLGDADYIASEWARTMTPDYFRRFQYIQDQRAAIDYMKNEVPPDAVVITYVGGWETFGYLARRPIIATEAAIAMRLKPTPNRPIYFVLTPGMGKFLWQRPQTYLWFEEHAILKAQFGRYSFYELPDGLPDDPSFGAAGPYERHPQSRLWFGQPVIEGVNDRGEP